MAWGDKLQRLPGKDLDPWLDNVRIEKEWVAHTGTRGAKNTQRNHIMYGRVFLRMFEDPVTTLQRQDIQAFVDRIEKKCPKLMVGAKTQCRLHHRRGSFRTARRLQPGRRGGQRRSCGGCHGERCRE